MQCTIQEIQHYITDMMRATVEICERNHITYYCQAGTVLGVVRHNGQIPWDHDADLIIPQNEIDRFVACAVKELPEQYYVDYFTVLPGSLRPFPRIGVKGYGTEFLHLDIFRLIGLPEDRRSQEALLSEIKVYRYRNVAMRLPFSFLARYWGRRMALLHLLLRFVPRAHYVKKIDRICNRYPYAQAKFVANPFGRYGVKNIFEKHVYGEGQLHDFEDFQARIPTEADFYLKQYYGDYMQLPPEDVRKKEMERIFDVR